MQGPGLTFWCPGPLTSPQSPHTSTHGGLFVYCCLIDMAPTLKSQELSVTMGAGVEARDRGPCVCGGGGGSAGGWEEESPHSRRLLGSDSERSFFSQCQSCSAGEGGRRREGGQLGGGARE